MAITQNIITSGSKLIILLHNIKKNKKNQLKVRILFTYSQINILKLVIMKNNIFDF